MDLTLIQIGKSALTFLLSFLREPALLLATIVAIGYIALGSSPSAVFSGAIKTAVGFRLLLAGLHVLGIVFPPLLALIGERFGTQGIVVDPYAGGFQAAQAALKAVDGTSWIGYTTIVALAVNVLLVMLRKWTKLGSIFLIGHIMYLQAALTTWTVYAFWGLDSWITILISGGLTGIYWAVGSHLTLAPIEKMSGGSRFTVGHQQMFGDWLVYKLAPRIGNPNKRVENIAYPKWLSFSHDMVVAPAVVMAVFVIITVLLSGGAKAITGIDALPGEHWVIKIILAALSFPVGITIVLVGVKMFVKELTASFEGIRKKLIPGAVVAVDSAAVYAFSPEAVLFGFLFGTFGQIAGIFLLILFGSPVLALPGFVILFFGNTTIGVFANHFGGARATMIICFASGLLQIIVTTYMAHLVGATGGQTYPGWGGNFDGDILWSAGALIVKGVRYLLGL